MTSATVDKWATVKLQRNNNTERVEVKMLPRQMLISLLQINYSYLPWAMTLMITKISAYVGELLSSRMKYSRVHVIPHQLVLSANSAHNF